MNDIFFNNHLLVQAIYLTVVGLVGFLIYKAFCKKRALESDNEFVLVVKGHSNGEYTISFSANDEITTEVAEKIIDKVVLDAGKKDPNIVRLLFTGSLKALTEDEPVSMWFEEMTGNNLKDQLKG